MRKQALPEVRTLFLWLLALLLVGCRPSPIPASLDNDLRQLVEQVGLEPLTAVSPSTSTPAQIALGQALYFETELSGNRDVSCATCHNPDFGLSDGLPLAVGTGGSGVGAARQVGDGRQFVPRNSQDVANRGLPGWQSLFWDGRLALSATGFTSPAGAYLPPDLDNLLAAQAMLAVTARHEMRGGLYNVAGYLIQPGEYPDAYQNGGERPLAWSDRDIDGRENELAAIGNAPEEMPHIWAALQERLLALPAYPPLFAAAYPDTPPEEWTFTHAANALAAFQTAAFTFTDTPWDRYLAGDEAALAPEAKQRGAALLRQGGLRHLPFAAICSAISSFTTSARRSLGQAHRRLPRWMRGVTPSPRTRPTASPSAPRRCATWPTPAPTCTMGPTPVWRRWCATIWSRSGIWRGITAVLSPPNSAPPCKTRQSPNSKS
jgi:cytochrome c peroxidase